MDVDNGLQPVLSTETCPVIKLEHKNLSTIIGELFQIYVKGFLKVISAMIIVQAIVFGVEVLIQNVDLPTRGFAGFGMAILMSLFYVVIYQWTVGVVIHTSASYNLTGSSSFSRSMSVSLRRLPRMTLAVILLFLLGLLLVPVYFILSIMYILGLIALVVIVIPVILYFVIKWSFILQAIIIEGAGPTEAFDTSSNLVDRYWWRTFGILLIIGIISGVIGYGLIYILQFLDGYEEIVANIIVTPLSIIGSTLLYYDIRSRKLRKHGVEEARAELYATIE